MVPDMGLTRQDKSTLNCAVLCDLNGEPQLAVARECLERTGDNLFEVLIDFRN